ncbi:MAG: VOC family protein, partial [Actinomycetota bacterium]
MGSPVVHFQVCAEDVDAMSAFYRDVFVWHIAPRRLTGVDAGVSGNYPYIEAEEGGIPGGFTDGISGGRGAVLVIGVDDIETTLARVERLGGRRRFPTMPAERMRMAGPGDAVASFELAEFEDPEGNVVEIVHPDEA